MPIYLRFLVIFFFLPTLFLWFFYFSYLKRYRRTFILALIFTVFFGVPWDILSVKTGVWWYHSAPTLGIWWNVLPLEEYFFTLLFPIFVISLTLVIKRYRQSQK